MDENKLNKLKKTRKIFLWFWIIGSILLAGSAGYNYSLLDKANMYQAVLLKQSVGSAISTLLEFGIIAVIFLVGISFFIKKKEKAIVESN